METFHRDVYNPTLETLKLNVYKVKVSKLSKMQEVNKQHK